MRKYQSQKEVTPPLSVVKPVAPKAGLPPKWEDGARMHSVRDASQILTSELGRGHSYDRLLALIRSGELTEGYHWWKTGGTYKLNIHRFIEWRSGTSS